MLNTSRNYYNCFLFLRIKLTFLITRSKVKLTTRDLKITLKQATIMIEEFYPSHVLCRIIGRSSSESSEGDLREIINQLDRMQGRNSSSTTKNVGIIEGGGSKGTPRRAGPVEPKFATVEEWWDSKGLAFGKYNHLLSYISSVKVFVAIVPLYQRMFCLMLYSNVNSYI